MRRKASFNNLFSVFHLGLLCLMLSSFCSSVRALRTRPFHRHGGVNRSRTRGQQNDMSSTLRYSDYEIDTQPVEIPLTDKRDYSIITLKNNLRCVLVSDKDSEKSAAALVVRTGASNDPSEFPGLAHFTEHMLFLGSEKYPKENSYKEYLSKHGGSSNGATGTYIIHVFLYVYH